MYMGISISRERKYLDNSYQQNLFFSEQLDSECYKVQLMGAKYHG